MNLTQQKKSYVVKTLLVQSDGEYKKYRILSIFFFLIGYFLVFLCFLLQSELIRWMNARADSMSRTQIISIHNLEDETSAVKLSVSFLRQGKLVVFPTETVYGLAALASDINAVERLCTKKGRRVGHALPIAISGEKILRRYVPNVSPLTLRLIRKFWPGPLTLVLNVTDPKSEISCLPRQSLKAIMPETSIGFRVPRNNFLLKVLHLIDEPLILTSANISGRTPATSADEAREALGTSPDLIIDDGKATFGQSSTVIKITDNSKVSVLREGAVPRQDIQKNIRKLIVFICSRNIRSVFLAEFLYKEMLAQRLGISAQDLFSYGYEVISATLFKSDSIVTSNIVAQQNLTFFHPLQMFNQTLAQLADRIYTLESHQTHEIVSLFPELQGKVFSFNCDVQGIDDLVAYQSLISSTKYL